MPERIRRDWPIPWNRLNRIPLPAFSASLPFPLLYFFSFLWPFTDTLSLSRVSSSSPPSPLFSINSNSVSLSLCLWNGEFYFAFLFNVWRSNDLSSRVFIFFFFFGSWSRGCFRRRRLQYLPRSFHPSRPCYCIPLHHSLFIHFFFLFRE